MTRRAVFVISWCWLAAGQAWGSGIIADSFVQAIPQMLLAVVVVGGLTAALVLGQVGLTVRLAERSMASPGPLPQALAKLGGVLSCVLSWKIAWHVFRGGLVWFCLTSLLVSACLALLWGFMVARLLRLRA